MSKEIIKEKVLDVCASGRISLRRKDGTTTYLIARDLDEFRLVDSITYRYIGCEHGVGLYVEI